MIRKAIIVVLTLGAVGTAVLWFSSHWSPILLQGPPTVERPWPWPPSVGRRPQTYVRRGILSIKRHRLAGYTQSARDTAIEFFGFRFERSSHPIPLPVLANSGGSLVAVTECLLARPTKTITSTQGVYRTHVQFPLWAPFTLLAAFPTLAFVRGPLRRWRRRKRGLCVKCGYNLTGLPEPRCPECGTKIRQQTD